MKVEGVPQDSYAFPLSFAQQRLWFLDRMVPGNPFYNIPLAAPVQTMLDVRALERALNAIVARHEALRTVFRVADGEPEQVVLPSLDLSITVTDLRALPPAERDERTIAVTTAEARTPFDLEKGPLVRCGVITRGVADHVLLLTLHHIISDGWSMGIFAQELTALYQDFATGYSRAPLPELPIQYPDFAMWQREQLQGESLERLLSYWRGQLRDLPVLDLPADRPRPPVVTYEGAYHPVTLTALLSQTVRRFGQQHQATPFMVLLTAFASLLRRYSGQDDLVIGTPVANRNRGEIERLIGFFVNSLVLRISAEGDPSFTELLARTREVALEAYAHQDLPFEKLVEELQPVRDPSRNPLFQVTFQLVDIPTLQSANGSGPRSSVQVQRGSAIFDLAFTLIENPAGFSGIFEYSTDLFDAATMARMDQHFHLLLQAAIDHPNVPLSALPIIDDAERAELIALSKAPVSACPAPFVHHAIARQAEQIPDAVAVQSEEGDLTYRQLAGNARRLARRLRAEGVGPDVRVGILMDRSADLVVALLGTLEAGAAYLPLDPTYPADRLRFMIGDSAATLVVTHAPHRELAASLAGENVRLVCLGDESSSRDDDAPFDVPIAPDDLAYVLYTSGSTGRPKGVAIPHRAIANHMQWMLERFPLQAHDAVLQRTPYGFDASVWEFLAPLMSGARLVMLPPDAHRNPEVTVQFIARYGVTVVQFVPALLRLLLEVPQLYTCSTLRRIFCGGEALSDELREKVVQSLPVELINLYGPTEATIDATSYTCGHAREHFGVPIGQPVTNMRAYVLDTHFNLVPNGINGELYLSGEGLARAYLDRPGITAERFLPDPISGSGARMYRTGDRVRRRADGTLLFAGRADEQVKLRGFRIELGEIETLIRRVPGVHDCAVVAETSGGEAMALTAFIVPDVHGTTAGAAGDMGEEHIQRWSEVYEQVYGNLTSAREPAFNTVGWNSSYTGLPINAAEMSEWRDATVERILALRPSHILEIGCGAGLLLTQLAPRCERYVATDFSAPVIRYLQSRIGHPNVTLLQHAADKAFDDMPAAAFDTVILNSVAQYFPDVAYFKRVLQQAIRVVAPGGAIFVGDVRSRALLDAFQLSLALHRTPDADPEELLQRVRLGVEQEQELVIDPQFFAAIAAEIGGIASVEITLKRGRGRNELTRFRYDVVLRVGTPRPEQRCSFVDWTRDGVTMESLGELLAGTGQQSMIIEGVPNARVSVEARVLELLEAGETKTIRALRREAEEEASGGIDPDALWSIAEGHGFHVRLRFSAAPRDHFFDVVLTRPGDTICDTSQFGALRAPSHAFVNNPLRGAMTRRIAIRVRDAISRELPEYMVPSAFVLLDELPLLANGKLSRAALSSGSHVSRRDMAGAYAAPRTSLEHALAIIWAEVLDVPRVGIRDDFFTDLGGHSLLATRLISSIRAAFRTEVPLKQIFETPMVEGFAASLLERFPDADFDATAELVVQLSRMSEMELDERLDVRYMAVER